MYVLCCIRTCTCNGLPWQHDSYLRTCDFEGNGRYYVWSKLSIKQDPLTDLTLTYIDPQVMYMHNYSKLFKCALGIDLLGANCFYYIL